MACRCNGWHANRFIFPNERLSLNERERVAYVQWHAGVWHLVNTKLPDMVDVASGAAINMGRSIALREGAQILLSREAGGRLVQVQVSNG
jgi:hypothetical protein